MRSCALHPASCSPCSWIVQVVGELLSQHIMKDYSKFVAGIDSVSAIESELHTLVSLAQAWSFCCTPACSHRHSQFLHAAKGLAQQCGQQLLGTLLGHGAQQRHTPWGHGGEYRLQQGLHLAAQRPTMLSRAAQLLGPVLPRMHRSGLVGSWPP